MEAMCHRVEFRSLSPEYVKAAISVRKQMKDLGFGAPLFEDKLGVFLEEAAMTVDEVLAERGKRYGSFAGNAVISQDFKAILSRYYRDCHTEVHKEALEMICQKMARILNGDPDYKDNWVDIGGYAKLGMGEKVLSGPKVKRDFSAASVETISNPMDEL